MRPYTTTTLIAFILVIVGALNWGLVGLFNYDAVLSLVGTFVPLLGRLIYIAVGLAGLYLIYRIFYLRRGL